MTYTEGTKYKLQADYYESILLSCTYVEDNKAYFKLDSDDQSLGSDYRLDIKSKKLHKWNSKYMSWDSIENTLSEHSADDIWSKRIGIGTGLALMEEKSPKIFDEMNGILKEFFGFDNGYV